MSASHEVVSWNTRVVTVFCSLLVGLSRGRELKWKWNSKKWWVWPVGLSRGRELKFLLLLYNWAAEKSASHEVVSWNILSCDEYRKYRVGLSRGRELKSFCLAVCFMCYWVGLSRGRELKYKYCTEREKTTESASHEVVSWNMTLFQEASKLCKSASHEAESWNEIYAVEDINAADVSFLEKLWVEITILSLMRSLTSSASMWGRELKYIIDMKILCMEKSASLWGCELK